MSEFPSASISGTGAQILDGQNSITLIPSTASAYSESAASPFNMSDLGLTVLTEPIIVRDQRVCRGEPIIRGTRISVTNIAELYYCLGWSMRKIRKEYRQLSEFQLNAALDYYKNHKEEIDSYLEEEKSVD